MSIWGLSGTAVGALLGEAGVCWRGGEPLGPRGRDERMAAAAASADWEDGDAGVLVADGPAWRVVDSAALAGEGEPKGQPARRGRRAAGWGWPGWCCGLVKDEMGGSEMPPWADEGREAACC